LLKATTDGHNLPPSDVEITVGCPPSITATTLFVVPKSIPIIFAIERLLAFNSLARDYSAVFFNVPILPRECKKTVNAM
jgi:hypothetical protein